MATNKILKLVADDSIHRIKENPQTFAGLYNIITSLIGPGKFKISYKDEEGDEITVTNDMSLQAAYESGGQKILKFFIKNENILISSLSQSSITNQNVQIQSQINSIQEKQPASPQKLSQQEQSKIQSSSVQSQEQNEVQTEIKMESNMQNQEQKSSTLQLVENKDQTFQQESQQTNLLNPSQIISQQDQEENLKEKNMYQDKSSLSNEIKSQNNQEVVIESKQFLFQDQSQQFPQFDQFRGCRRDGQGCGRFSDIQQQDPSSQQSQQEKFPKFYQKYQKLIEQNITPEFERMTGLILQELKNSQLSKSEQNIAKKVVHSQIRCDGCQVHPIVGIRYKCSVCKNYNFCMKCESRILHEHAFFKIKNLTQVPNDLAVLNVDQQQQNQRTDQKQQPLENQINSPVQQIQKSQEIAQSQFKVKKFKSKVVEHLTYSGICEVEAGSIILKTWKVQNTGNEIWPQNLTLKLKDGNLDAQPCQIPVLNPGQEGLISLKITVPKSEGRFQGVYKFITPKGDVFGQKLDVQIISKIKNQQQKKEQLNLIQSYSQKEQKQQVQAPKSILEEQIDNIVQMGFQNRELIKQMIQMYDGDIKKVMDDLLSQAYQ